MAAIPRGNGGAGAIPRHGGGSGAIPRGGAGGTSAQARNGLTGSLAIARPVDPNAQKPLNTNDPGYQQVLASVVGKPFFQQTAAIEQWMKANHYYVPDDQHIDFDAAGSARGQLASGSSGFSWTKAALALGAPFAGVAAAGALGGGAGAAAANPWEIGPTTAANFAGDALGPSTAASMAGTDAALSAPAAISGAGLGPVAGGAAGAAAGATGGGGGFLSTLGKLGTGVLGALGKVGGPLAVTAGSIENQRAAALAAAAKIQQQQDYLAQQRALLALKAPGMEAANSVRGDVLANSQDASFSGLPSYIHIPTMSGGLRPSMLSDNSHQLGGVMSRNALANQLSGNDVPALTPLPTSNGTDTLLQGLTLGGGFLNALSGLQGSSPSSSGGSSPPPSGGGYQGAGTSGFPGDGMSPINNPMPPVDPTQGIDPNDMAWWAQQAAGGFS